MVHSQSFSGLQGTLLKSVGVGYDLECAWISRIRDG